MNLSSIIRLLRYNVKSHSPIILSCTAGVGVLATAFLASKATVEAVDIIREDEEGLIPKFNQGRMKWERRTKLVWKLYIPSALSATTTIVCIVGANRINAKKILAAQTAFAVTERAYSEYKDKVIEQYGEKVDEKIRDSVAEDRVKKNAPEIIIAGSGGVLCCELYTMRYFESDVETLKRAQNEVNAKLLSNDYVGLDYFYHLINLSGTTPSGHLGWKTPRLFELELTSMLTENDQPCLAIGYNYIQPL